MSTTAPPPLVPARRLWLVAAGLVWLGWAAITVTLLTHTSRGGSVLGRYSLGFALVIAAALAGLAALSGRLFGLWRRGPAGLQHDLRALPPATLPLYLIAAPAALIWTQQIGRLWFGLLGQPGLLLGLAALLLGLGLLLYGALPLTFEATRRAGAAALWAVPVYLVALAAGFQPDTRRALLLIPALVAVAAGAYAAMTAEMVLALRQRLAAALARLRSQRGLLGAGLLLAGMALVYAPGLRHALLGDDELRLLWPIVAPDGFTRWVTTHPAFLPLIRPLFTLQATLLYRLFGINAAAYYVAEVLTLAASALLLYGLVWRVGRRALPALLVALVFSTHSYVTDLVTGWAFDTGPLTGLLIVLAAWLVVLAGQRLRSYLALGALLVLAPISRENGLALPGAVTLYCLAGLAGRWLPQPGRPWLTGRRAAALFGLAIGCLAGYFAWRTIALPGWWQQTATFGESTAFFNVYYSGEAVKALPMAARLPLYAYTLGANVVANTLPVLGPFGGLWEGPLYAWGLLAAGLLIVHAAFAATAAPVAKGLPHPRAVLEVVGLAALLFFAAAQPSPLAAPELNLDALQFALHAALTLGVAAALAGRLRWSRAGWAMAVLGIGLIVANSVVVFPYFRYRSQYFGFIGWALLLAAVLAGLRGRPGRADLRRTLLVGTCALALVSGLRLYRSLPVPRLLPENYPYTVGLLCDPALPPELFTAIRDRYGLDAERLAECQAATSEP